jgi:hypothetical protein
MAWHGMGEKRQIDIQVAVIQYEVDYLFFLPPDPPVSEPGHNRDERCEHGGVEERVELTLSLALAVVVIGDLAMTMAKARTGD